MCNHRSRSKNVDGYTRVFTYYFMNVRVAEIKRKKIAVALTHFCCVHEINYNSIVKSVISATSFSTVLFFLLNLIFPHFNPHSL